MPNALRFKHTSVERQQGEQARFKVIQGPDYGAVYVVFGKKVSIGRGEENDLVISDLKASRVHATIAMTPQGWTIKDLGSANGILYNGRSVRDSNLKMGDTITVGETTLEFILSDVGTKILMAPARSVDQFQSEQRRLLEVQGKAKVSSPTQAPVSKNSRLLILGGGGLVILYFLFGGDEKPRPPPKKKQEVKQDLAAFLPSVEKNKTAEMLFKDGFREYLNGNYSRARTQFETVLQVLPGHPLATLYLENCTKSVEESVKRHLENGKKALSAGKYKEARANFERIQRLFYRDQVNPAYIEAKSQIEKLDKAMKDMNEAGN